MSFLNLYSFPITAVFVFAVVAVGLLRDGVTRRDIIALSAIAGAIVFSWWLIRPGSSTLAEVSQVESALRSGKPTLVEFQSPY